MSKCISRHGEYGDHENDAKFTCQRCFAFDEAAALARVADLEAEVERLAGVDVHAWVARTAEAVAKVAPCSCSAQRARAEAAEAKIAAVREIVATPPSMLGQPVARWADRLLMRLRAALDGDAEVATIPTTLATIEAGPTFACTFEDEHKTDGELLEEAEAKLARAPCHAPWPEREDEDR